MTRRARVPYEAAAAAIVARMAGPHPAGRAVVLIDGGSGSGKTSLAGEVARLWAERATGAADELQVVSLDSVYPGWQGLAAASAQVPYIIGTDEPGYRGWDWGRDVPTAWVPVDPTRPILVEGCGALTRASAPRATLRVWVELDAPTRKARALARDHGGFDAYWDLWAAQEHAHWAAERPWALADLLVDGPSEVLTARP